MSEPSGRIQIHRWPAGLQGNAIALERKDHAGFRAEEIREDGGDRDKIAVTRAAQHGWNINFHGYRRRTRLARQQSRVDDRRAEPAISVKPSTAI